jgi:alcohol dehydrogenase class IV
MRFEFATASRIIFGAGTLREIGPITAEMGRRAFVVTGRDTARVKPLTDLLSEQGIQADVFAVTGEPTTGIVQKGTEHARESGCDMVLGCGGGGVLDAGKAIAALMPNAGNLMDYLEVIGHGKPLTQPPAPYIAIPTTSGTGAEVTRNAVLGSPEHGVKVSLRHPLMLPRVALVDPELTYSMSPEITASTGLDALTQLIEPYVSKQANPMTGLFCREGLSRVARSLRRAYEDGRNADANSSEMRRRDDHDAAARDDMALASLYGGLALANAKLGSVHGFAAPIGGMFPAPHGAVCARLLPVAMEINVRALKERQPEHPALLRYDEVAHILTGNPAATAQDGVAWVQSLCRDLNVPALSTYGITQEAFPALIEKAAVASSMQGNPVKLTTEEMQEILVRAC